MDLEELLDEWKYFTLREEELEANILLDAEEIKEINDDVDQCLVGKLLSNRNISAIAIKNALVGAWKTRETFNTETVGKNMFLFKFKSQDDRNWVMKSGPWFFDKSLLVLEAPLANQKTTDIEFKKTAFWIRLINLPMGYRKASIAEKIGNSIGEFIEADCERGDLNWGNSIRIRVKLDISRPLLRGFMLRTTGIEGKTWVSVRYERLPEFCYICGRIGHVAKDCKCEGTNNQQRQNFEFGTWLRFQGFLKPSKRQESPPKRQSNDQERAEAGQNVNKDLGSDKVADSPRNIDLNREEDESCEQGSRNDMWGDKLQISQGEASSKPQNQTEANETRRTNSKGKGISSGFEVSARKNVHRKRRVRLGQLDSRMEKSSSPQKRKAVEDLEVIQKKARLGEDELMEDNETCNNLAVAGCQPCLGP